MLRSLVGSEMCIRDRGEREELTIQVKERENDVDKLKQVIEEAKQDVKETKQELKQVEEKFMFVSFVMVLLLKMF